MVSTCILRRNIKLVSLMENKANSKVRVADSFRFWLCKTSSLIYAIAGLGYVEYMKRVTSGGGAQLVQHGDATGITIYFVACACMACNQVFYFIWVK